MVEYLGMAGVSQRGFNRVVAELGYCGVEGKEEEKPGQGTEQRQDFQRPRKVKPRRPRDPERPDELASKKICLCGK